MICRDRQTAFLPGLKIGVSCLVRMKAAVDTAQQSGHALLPAISTAFEERYRRILEAEEREAGTTGVPREQRWRGRKKQPNAKNLMDRCRNYQGEILAFMKGFTRPFTNTQAERDLRDVPE